MQPDKINSYPPNTVVHNNDFNFLYIKELEEWVRSMYLIPEEFDFQKRKILNKVKEKIMEEGGW
jgi:hypothetical protein